MRKRRLKDAVSLETAAKARARRRKVDGSKVTRLAPSIFVVGIPHRISQQIGTEFLILDVPTPMSVMIMTILRTTAHGCVSPQCMFRAVDQTVTLSRSTCCSLSSNGLAGGHINSCSLFHGLRCALYAELYRCPPSP